MMLSQTQQIRINQAITDFARYQHTFKTAYDSLTLTEAVKENGFNVLNEKLHRMDSIFNELGVYMSEEEKRKYQEAIQKVMNYNDKENITLCKEIKDDVPVVAHEMTQDNLIA